VIPAWKIGEVLDVPELKKVHAYHEAEIKKINDKRNGGAV